MTVYPFDIASNPQLDMTGSTLGIQIRTSGGTRIIYGSSFLDITTNYSTILLRSFKPNLNIAYRVKERKRQIINCLIYIVIISISRVIIIIEYMKL